MGVYEDYRMCYGKKAYRKDTADRVLEQRQEHQPDLRIYHCPICHKWHMTKKKERHGP